MLYCVFPCRLLNSCELHGGNYSVTEFCKDSSKCGFEPCAYYLRVSVSAVDLLRAPRRKLICWATAGAPPDLVFVNHACCLACFRDVGLFPTEIPKRNTRKHVFPNSGQCACLLDVLCAGALALPQTFRQTECTQEAWTWLQRN